MPQERHPNASSLVVHEPYRPLLTVLTVCPPGAVVLALAAPARSRP